MSFQTNKELVFSPLDLVRSRMSVEKEKMQQHFPSFDFYSADGRISSVRGYITTSYGNSYYIRVAVGAGYPYQLPDVTLPNYTIESSCPHRFNDGRICIMRSGQWSSSLSLAFVVAKAALWLNKYDSWKRNGCRAWPGKGQSH